MFTEAHLINFGNYLLKTYGVSVYSSDGKNIPIYQREVSHADMCNWKDVHPMIADDPVEHTNYPSRYKIDQYVWFRLWSADIAAQIHSIHFYEGKVKYDLKLIGGNGETTRVYNVDSIFVKDKIPEKVMTDAHGSTEK